MCRRKFDVISYARSLLMIYLYKIFSEETSHDEYQCKDEISISHDLLIWSLFAHRPQLATLFWKTSENQLCTYICIACKLAKKWLL